MMNPPDCRTGLEGEENGSPEYYVNQLRETDAFIDALLAELAQWDEPVVWSYSDHLPGLISRTEPGQWNDIRPSTIIWSSMA